MNEKLMYNRIRNIVGLLGMLLPWISLISGLFVVNANNNHTFDWWYSISATYYISPALIAILTSASIVLMCYDGYDWIDNLVTTISGVFGLCVVLFSCSCSYVTDFIPSGRVGFFQIPVNISNIIHCTCATIFFILLACNSFFLFTKTGSNGMTSQKKKRNIIYRASAIGMLLGLVVSMLPFLPDYKVFIGETIALSCFGISWLTKGGVIFKDKE